MHKTHLCVSGHLGQTSTGAAGSSSGGTCSYRPRRSLQHAQLCEVLRPQVMSGRSKLQSSSRLHPQRVGMGCPKPEQCSHKGTALRSGSEPCKHIRA